MRQKPFKAAKPKPLPKIYVKPAVPGKGPRDDVTRIKLPDAGEWVPDNHWWNRRLMHKDVVRAEPPAETATEVEPAPPEVETPNPSARAEADDSEE